MRYAIGKTWVSGETLRQADVSGEWTKSDGIEAAANNIEDSAVAGSSQIAEPISLDKLSRDGAVWQMRLDARNLISFGGAMPFNLRQPGYVWDVATAIGIVPQSVRPLRLVEARLVSLTSQFTTPTLDDSGGPTSTYVSNVNLWLELWEPNESGVMQKSSDLLDSPLRLWPATRAQGVTTSPLITVPSTIRVERGASRLLPAQLTGSGAMEIRAIAKSTWAIEMALANASFGMQMSIVLFFAARHRAA